MNRIQRRRSLAFWVIVALLLLAFALRTHVLGARELTFDEVGSVSIAARGPAGLLAYVRDAIREHPPFYYLLLSLWMPLVGRSEFVVRYLSVIIGIVTVAVMYRLVCSGERAAEGQQSSVRLLTALLTTLLLVLSPFHVRVSQGARMYGLLALWSLLSIFTFIRILNQDRAPWRWSTAWGVLWLVTCLGMFTHYFMAFVLIAEDLFLMLNWRRYRHLWGPWLATHGALGGVIVLWAILSPGLGATLLSLWRRGFASDVRWAAFSRAVNGLYLGATLRPNWYHLSLPLILTGLGVGVAQRRFPWLSRKQQDGGLLLGLLLVVPLAAVLALPERVTGRYLTAALPASILAMGLGMAWLIVHLVDRSSRRVVVRHWSSVIGYPLSLLLILSVIFVDASAYSSVYFPPGESFRDKMAHLRAHAQPDDALLLHGPWQILLLSYYDAGPLETYTVPLHELRVEEASLEEKLTQILEKHSRVWCSYNSVDPVDPDWLVARWLHEHTHHVWSRGDLILYHRAPAPGLPSEPSEISSRDSDVETTLHDSSRVFLPIVMDHKRGAYERVERVGVQFGDRLQLKAVALSNLKPIRGEAVLVLTQWRALEEIPHGLTMRLELVDPADEVGEDYQFRAGPAHVPTQRWSAGETFVERRGIVVPVGMPPGTYRLRVRVFSPEGEEWLPADGPFFEIDPVSVGHSTPPTRVLEALPGRELHVTFGDELVLVGHEPGGLRFTQGNPLPFRLYWQALASPSEEYQLEIRLVDQAGVTAVERRVQPAAGWFPTDRWQPGDVVLGRHVVPLPMDLTPGRYRVQLAIHAADGTPLLVSGSRSRKVLDWWEQRQSLSGTDVVLFEAAIEARPRRYRPPAMDHRVDATFGDDIRLLGYDLTSTSVDPGDVVELTLTWKALRRMEPIYAVFNHLVSPDGTLLAQTDGWPQEGVYHTNQWLAGEVVVDHYTVQVPSDASPGEYTLRVGLYNAATHERPVTLVDDTPVPGRYVQLATVTVGR